MTTSGATRLLSIVLVVLLAASPGFGQAPASPPAAAAQTPSSQPAPPPRAALPESPASPLSIILLEGENVMNSLPLLRSVAPVVQIVDQNGFPVEGATVVFTLPEQGPGGTFTSGGTSFPTQSDSAGQAACLVFAPKGEGKFQIKVTATSGQHHGEAFIHQVNTTRPYVGPIIKHPWYKRKLTWIVIGGAAAAAVALVLVLHSSSSKGVTITPGPPVF